MMKFFWRRPEPTIGNEDRDEGSRLSETDLRNIFHLDSAAYYNYSNFTTPEPEIGRISTAHVLSSLLMDQGGVSNAHGGATGRKAGERYREGGGDVL